MRAILSKLSQLIKSHQSDIALVSVVIAISIISFQSGKIYALKQQSGGIIEIKQAALEEIFESKNTATNVKQTKTVGQIQYEVIASKNSDKYHFSWCPGAGKISKQNKIPFPTEAAALAAGYILAFNCKK